MRQQAVFFCGFLLERFCVGKLLLLVLLLQYVERSIRAVNPSASRKPSMGVHRILLSVLTVAGSIVPGTAKGKYLYHIPWACSVVYTNGDLIGPCAIIEDRAVVVSPDNFKGLIAASNPPKRYYEDVDEIFVHAGSNYMDPTKLAPKQKSRFIQTRRAYRFYAAFKRPAVNGGQWDFRLNPNNLSEQAGAEHDEYGLAFDVGFLVLLEPFGRSSYVLPMLIKGPDVPLRTADFLKILQTSAVRTNSCITYSWNQELNRIRYHEVTYQPQENCLEVFCNWKLSSCRKFPTKDYLLCFKSVKYVDVCPSARGAALYCPAFDHSVLAILTTAPSCGQRHMPGVYTTLPMVIDLFETIFKVRFEPEKRSVYDVFSLPQQDSDYIGIF